MIDGAADYGNNKIGLPRSPARSCTTRVHHQPTRVRRLYRRRRGLVDVGGPVPRATARRVLGGRTGRDGIRGATFSSLTMDATTGEVAGASVQIGDPIVEKLLIDVLPCRCRAPVHGDHRLWRRGSPSAVGEMAEGVGADVELDRVPLKYAGLEPWEIWLSEAQERMVIAVPADKMAELDDRCGYYGVELADIGEFTGDGRLVVRSGGTPVLDMSTEFLHDGRPQRQLTAKMPQPSRGDEVGREVDDPRGALLSLLSHLNTRRRPTRSTATTTRSLGATVVRPLVGRLSDAPADGIVLAEPNDDAGLRRHRRQPVWWGLHDPEAMAYGAVDEAMRNVVACGGDPDRRPCSTIPSWGDPRRDRRSANSSPPSTGPVPPRGDGLPGSVRPGRTSVGTTSTPGPTAAPRRAAHPRHHRRRTCPKPTAVWTPSCANPGKMLVLALGSTATEFAGSHLDPCWANPTRSVWYRRVSDPDAPTRYRHLHRDRRGARAVVPRRERGRSREIPPRCASRAGSGPTSPTPTRRSAGHLRFAESQSQPDQSRSPRAISTSSGA
ncbi:MAG: AIR synthase-related protein [Ilumatobacteraceae bacterium]